jgi:hypothetical protein
MRPEDPLHLAAHDPGAEHHGTVDEGAAAAGAPDDRVGARPTHDEPTGGERRLQEDAAGCLDGQTERGHHEQGDAHVAEDAGDLVQ